MQLALPDVLLYKSTRGKDLKHRCMLRYAVLLSSSLYLICFFILVFYLKQEHEERQRLLHYLQQTNTAIATGTLIYVINQEIEDNKLNVYNPDYSLNITQGSLTFLNCLETF